MNKNLSKNNMLKNITTATTILLAIVCNIITIAVLALYDRPPPSNKIIKNLTAAKHLVYTIPDASEKERINIKDSDIFYTYKIIISDENGKSQFLKMKSLSAVKHK